VGRAEDAFSGIILCELPLSLLADVQLAAS
jgi:hypothetical protein